MMNELLISLWSGSIGRVTVERLFLAGIEVAVLAGLVALGVWLFRIRSPQVRSLLWLIVLIKPVLTLAFGTLVPVTTLSALSWMPGSPPGVSVITKEATTLGGAGSGNANPVTTTHAPPPRAAARRVGFVAPVVWVAGVLIGVALMGFGRLRIRRVTKQTRAVSAAIQMRYAAIGNKLGIRRPPPIRVTTHLESPALVGSFAPQILIPRWMADEGVTSSLDWSIRHELTHFKRRDHLSAFATEICGVLFFFHPVVWWATRCWRHATEMACDIDVADTRGGALDYADELYQIIARVHDRRRVVLAGSLFATRSQIGRRIEALLRNPARTRPGKAALVAVAVFAVVVMGVGAEFSRVVAEAHEVEIGKTVRDSDVSVYFTSTVDGREVKRTIRITGSVRFSEDYRDVTDMGEESRLNVVETIGKEARELVATPGDGGKPVYDYKVNDEKAQFDKEAKKWLAAILEKHISKTKTRRHPRNRIGDV